MSLDKPWKWVKLGKAVQVLDNLRKPINTTERQKRIAGKLEKELYPYYGATGQVGWIDSFITNGEYVLVGEDGAPFLDIYKPKAYKIKGKTWVNNHAHILKEIEEVTINDFVLHFLNSLNYRQYVNGTTRLKLTKGSLVEIPFPLPPKPTQLAIVSKIEELFSELDKGIEQLKTAQYQLKTYRQAVLKWAFEGKLTNEHMKDGELPVGWKSLELGKVCSLITDGKHGDCVNEDNSGYYFLSAKDVRNNTLIWENARQITKAGFEETHRRTNLKPGDICLVNTGATIGRISLAPNDEKTYKSTFQKSVAVIKCIPDFIDNKYCKYLLQGDLRKLVKVSSGTAVPNLLLGTLKSHLINLPPSIEEQNKIVQEIESRLSVADKMEESINQSLQQAEALRQSILKKAFEGRLV